jgi:Na+-driven multidrug efflux pump
LTEVVFKASHFEEPVPLYTPFTIVTTMHRKAVCKGIVGVTIVIALLTAVMLAAVPSTVAAIFTGDVAAAAATEEGASVTLVTLLVGIIAAVAFVLSGFFNGKLELASVGKTENFDWPKLVATAIMGVIVGVVLTVTHVAVTEENVLEALLAYAGLTAIVYKLVKGIFVYYGLAPGPDTSPPSE